MRDQIRFFLNGQPHSVRGDDAFVSFTEFLPAARFDRDQGRLREGDCGAWTVLIGRPDNDRLLYDLSTSLSRETADGIGRIDANDRR